MPRQLRVSTGGFTYHVLNRAVGRMRIPARIEKTPDPVIPTRYSDPPLDVSLGDAMSFIRRQYLVARLYTFDWWLTTRQAVVNQSTNMGAPTALLSLYASGTTDQIAFGGVGFDPIQNRSLGLSESIQRVAGGTAGYASTFIPLASAVKPVGLAAAAETTSSAVTRRQVLANIAESQAARASSNFTQYLGTETMYGLTYKSNAALAANPGLAQTVLSPAEYQAAQASIGIAQMQYGNAVERLVAQEIRNSPKLGNMFEHVGGPNATDFNGVNRFGGLNWDITTDTLRQYNAHVARPYQPIVIPYSRPATFTTFP